MRRQEKVLSESIINVTEDKSAGGSIPKSKGKYARAGELRYSKLSRPKTTKQKAEEKPPESVMQWFDKSMENELEKRRIEPSGLPKSKISRLPAKSGLRNRRIADSIPSAVEMLDNLEGDVPTDLTNAADKFAKAEAIVAFEGAVRAAEAAAALVPPEMAEEAAVAGARGYQAELTNVIKENVPGARPIEVIGYIGITRPNNFPAKRNF